MKSLLLLPVFIAFYASAAAQAPAARAVEVVAQHQADPIPWSPALWVRRGNPGSC